MSNQGNNAIKVFIVGDSPIMRSGLRKVLEAQTFIHVLGEVSVRRVNVETISRHNPDLVLVDLDPRAHDTLGFVSTCREVLENSAVLLLSDIADHELVQNAFALGAAGLVLKMQPPGVLIAAIRELCPPYCDHSVSRTVTGAIRHTNTFNQKSVKVGADTPDMPNVDRLTAREREIISLIALGLKNKEIAHRLSISDITVRHHLTSIFCKLGVTDRQKLLIIAHRYGLADLTLQGESP